MIWHRLKMVVLLSLGTLATFSGCSPAGPQRYPVSGTVTLDGKPVSQATIIFTPQEQGLAAAAAIENGQFRFTAEDGPTAGVFSVRVNPNAAELQEVAATELAQAKLQPRIPQAYQRPGTLTTHVHGRAEQVLEFVLSTKQQ